MVDVAAALSVAFGAVSRPSPQPGPVDEAAFTAVYEATAAPLRAFLRRICGDPAAADDLLQETYLRFYRARFETVGERETRAYLFRVATNLATDRWRRAGRRGVAVALEEAEGRLSTGAGGPARSPDEADHGRRADVSRVFALLPPRERAMLWLAYVEGCDHAEIAERIGAGKHSVRVLLFRARRKLARLLSQRGLGPEGMA